MKRKVLFLGFVIGIFVLTSCKKEYKCDYEDNLTVEYSDKDYSDSQIEAAKNACDKSEGTWSQK